MANFATKCVNSWSELNKAIAPLKDLWVFRGQAEDWPLATSLERALNSWKIELSYGPVIEYQLVREFRRQYNGEDRYDVANDTLYCLALMQHHGAPTRLLDFTYSPFVGAQFAIGEGNRFGVLWCINTFWGDKAAGEVVGKQNVALRANDRTRNDKSFRSLFTDTQKKFVLPENPLRLSQRFVIQKGVFLCAGDVADTFINNLKNLAGWNSEGNILKLRFDMNRNNLVEATNWLRKMNVGSATLFPGLDGFARSLKEQLPHYQDYAIRGVGLPSKRSVKDVRKK